ncbi:MAG: MSMEG_4193 family putative phosphomutase [Chloroflexota bacterium]
MATIILVRHGENDWVSKHRLAGWIEGVHLNENGHKQAEDVAQRLKDIEISTIYSSPVTRCMETADYIAKVQNLPIQELPEVGEVRYGKWEGKKIAKLAKKSLWRVVQFFPSRLRFPNGEALREVQFRAIQALEDLSEKHQNETIVVCSHADLIKLVLAHYLGVHMDLFQRIVISPASASVITLPENGMMRVIRMNDTGLMKTPKKPAPKKKKSKKKDKKK